MIETFDLLLPSGETARFSIWKSAFKKEISYFAKIIDVKKVNPRNNFGNIIRSGEKTVYYSDPIKLKNDIIAFYGV
ncbi:MAG: hypothetical protein JNL60_04385 [Bacteroidia bacterium]|nr:hypothetical protein [Bacteroidia bacterium]